MYSQIKNDLEEGISRVKWFGRLLSERLRIEITVFRLMYRAEELKKKRAELLATAGEEVLRLYKSEKGIHSNKRLVEILKEVESIEPDIRDNEEKISEVSRAV